MEFKKDFWIEELQRIGKVAIFTFDIKSGNLASTDVLYELFGVNGKNMSKGKEWLNLIDPAQIEELRSYFIDKIKHGTDFNKEFKLVVENDRSEKWIVIKGKVFFDENGVAEKLSGTISDVSELKISEERYKKLYMELLEKEALLSSLINSIPDLIYYKDTNSKYLGCNKAYEKFFGIKQEEIIGKTDFEIYKKEMAEACKAEEVKMIQQEKCCMYEEWNHHLNDQPVLLDKFKSPYYDSEGNILGIIGVSRDITERSKKEELQKKIEEETRNLNELKETERIRTEFFTNISHELRTPINVIFSALQMEEIMLEKGSNEKSIEDKFKYINMMKQNCYRLLRLIENLIDITKFDNGYFNINKGNYDIISSIENVVLSVADFIENKDISVIFDTNVEEKIISFDEEKMERIILNLLSNAVKFTSRGGQINVIIEDNKSNICIRVKDNGKGIPDNKLNSIFERFVQVDKSFKRNHEGSGIGLSIVKSLVEQHGGTIAVTSKVGQGTEFIVCIPYELNKSEVSNNGAYDAQRNKSSIERINIEFSDI